MKKIVLVVLFALMAATLFAKDWFGMEWGFDVGYASRAFADYQYVNTYFMLPGDSALYYFEGYEVDGDLNGGASRIFLTMDVRFWFFELLFVGGGSTVMMKTNPPFLPGDWYPTFTNYTFEAGISWKMFTLRYTHECTHPSNTYGFSSRIVSLWGEGSVDRLALEISGSVGRVKK